MNQFEAKSYLRIKSFMITCHLANKKQSKVLPKSTSNLKNGIITIIRLEDNCYNIKNK